MAVDAGLYRSDRRVRRMVREAFNEGVIEIRLWGDVGAPEVDGGCGSVQHRLSVAARAFKAQALAAVAVQVDAIDVTETFRGGDPPRVTRTPDLVTAS